MTPSGRGVSECQNILCDTERDVACTAPSLHEGPHRRKEWWYDSRHHARVAVTTTWGEWEPDPDAPRGSDR